MTLSLDRTAKSTKAPAWQTMTWLEYEQWREQSTDRLVTDRLAQWYFNLDRFLVRDMGWEGMSHAEVKDLFILLISLWYMVHPEQTARSMSGGLLEKPDLQAASPDLIFELVAGKYQQIEVSRVMVGITTDLLKEALTQWAAGTGVAIGNWFMTQIQAA